MLRIRLFGGVAVEAEGRAVPASLLAGRQGRLVLAYLACAAGRPVSREELAEVLWVDSLPESWPTSLSSVVSRLRRLFTETGLDGQQVLASTAAGYQLVLPDGSWVDWRAAHDAIELAERAIDAGDAAQALTAAAEADALVASGFLTDDCEWVDRQRDIARDIAVRAAATKAAAHLAAGSPRRAVEDAREALRRDPLREASFRVLMRALAAAGERAAALRTWEHCRATLVEELGVDPSPETEAVYLELLEGAPPPAPVTTELPSGVVTFLLTDIVESSTLWERHPTAMAAALERHDALIAEVIGAHGGTVLKAKLEGDATVSVFARASAGAHAALTLLDAFDAEEWPQDAAPRVRMALHTGEAFERGGDYFGPALNRAARLRSLAGGGQVLLSQAVAELVADHLPEGFVLADRGHRDLRGMSRGENVFELIPGDAPSAGVMDVPLVRPDVPAPLAATGPFVGRTAELAELSGAWERAVAGGNRALLLAGEPGVGKSRLAAEAARHAHEGNGLVLYGGCDEELGAPLQPFLDAIRPLVGALGAARLRRVHGLDGLSRMIPELGALVPDLASERRVDPDAERYALFDAITRLLTAATAEAPVLLVLDDLHWAGRTTLALLRHLLRNAESARLLVVGTYRDTELARTHPLAAMLADLHRDGTADRLTLGGLGAEDVTAYLHAVGRPDRALGRELAKVTSGNPFFLIETLRHVEETGGMWEEGGLPQGIREATGRRLSRLSDGANDALTVAAVAGTTFSLELVEAVAGTELVDEIDEARRAGLVDEEAGAPGQFRFAHALVRQVLLAELVTVKRIRLHRKIADLLEASAGDGEAHLTELAHHWFECASSGDAGKAVAYCRRAADTAVERLAYEEAADLYGMALQALEGVGDEPGATRHDLLLARCDALLTAGEVTEARRALDELHRDAESPHLRAWHAVFAAQLAVLAEPERLTDVVESVGSAAAAMHDADDMVGEAKAHYVHALALDRLGHVGASEQALDAALASARKSGDRRLADAVLAGAPQAALWGPSPVISASGRCLDVVRVLRITSGTPAVEAVAFRCQAVLEALRGRMDAARRMIESARQAVDELGLTVRALETDVMAGLIELFDGEAEAAEARLRPAFEALRDRGLGGEAAFAAALLGRALLAQGRDEEAEAAGSTAAELAGSDLKASITWRGVLAETAARRGDTERALELAHAAVELAAATDALLLVADARRSLASVLWSIGDAGAAQQEARRTAEVCDAKGATALAERARAAGGAAPAPVEAPTTRDAGATLVNAALRVHMAINDAFEAGDWDRLISLTSASWQIRDGRTVGTGELSAEESIANMRYAFRDRSIRWVVEEILATRGDRLVLLRGGYDRVHDGEVESSGRALAITRLDDQGRRDLIVNFDEDDLDAAFAELDRLFADGEAASAPGTWHALTEIMDALSQGDVEGMREWLAPGFAATGSHSPVASLDADSFSNYVRGMDALRPGARYRLLHVPAVERTRALVIGTLGVPDDFELHAVMVYELDGDGRFLARWGYPIEHLNDAWRQYRELGGRDDANSSDFANAATRTHDEFVHAWEERDWDHVDRLFAPAWHIDDRRSQGSGVLTAEESRSSLRLVFESDEIRWIVEEQLATRGDRLVLTRRRIDIRRHGAPIGEYRSLSIWGVDEAGRREISVDFDEDDVDAAFDELDRLYAEGEAATALAAWHTLSEVVAAISTGDAERLRAVLAPGFRSVGSRSNITSRDADDIEYVEGVGALRSEARARYLHVLALEPTRALAIGLLGVPDDVELQAALVYELDDQGRLVGRWRYAIHQLDEAWERYGQLGTDAVPVGERFPSGATALAEAMDRAWSSLNVAACRSLFTADAEIVTRRFVGDPGADPFELFVASARLAVERGAEVVRRSRPIATRGQWLALVNVEYTGSWGTAGEAELGYLAVLEVNGDGLGTRAEFFDVDDLDAAYDELDQRYDAGEASGTGFWERTRMTLRAQHARDREAMLATYAPHFRFVDHRRFGWGELDRTQFVSHTQGVYQLRADATIRMRHVLAVEAGRSLTVGTNTGGLDAGDYEQVFVSANEIDASGRTVRRDCYDLDQLDDAWERYHAIGRCDGPLGERFPNLATRLATATDAAFAAGDMDRIWKHLYVPDAEFSDRRTLIDAGLDPGEVFRPLFPGVGGARLRRRSSVVATRGSRLALVHVVDEDTWAEAESTAFEYLAVLETDGDGRGTRGTFIDVDQLDAAYEELERRFVEGEAAGGRSFWGRALAFGRASRARDYEEAATWFAPGFSFVNHRALGWGDLDAAGFIEHVKAMDDVRGDVVGRVRHVLALDERRSLAVTVLTGEADDGDLELPIVSVMEADSDGRALRRDVYDLEQVDEAWARYHEIGAATPSIGARFPNTATRRAEELCLTFNSCDFDGFVDLFSGEYRYVDGRLTTVDVGLDAYLDNMRSRFAERRDITWDLRPIATRGDRLALFELGIGGSWGDAGATVLENLLLSEVDAEGKGVLAEVFDIADLDAAYAELDRRYGELERPGRAWKHTCDLAAAVNGRDYDGAAALFAPGFRFVSHRPLGWGTIDADTLIAHSRSLAEIRGEVRNRCRHVLAVDDRRGLTVATVGDSASSDFEMEVVFVVKVDGEGRAVQRDSYTLEQLDEAWARYEEVGVDEAPIGARFPNAATTPRRRGATRVERPELRGFERGPEPA